VWCAQRVVECGTQQGLFPHPIAADQLSEFLNSTAAAMRQQSSASLPADPEGDAAEAALEDAFEREMRIRRNHRRRRWGARARRHRQPQEAALGGGGGEASQGRVRGLARAGGGGARLGLLLGRMRRVLSIFVSSSSLARTFTSQESVWPAAHGGPQVRPPPPTLSTMCSPGQGAVLPRLLSALPPPRPSTLWCCC